MVARYEPGRGDVVWVDLNPTRGHEQASVRPCVVVSPKNYNRKSGLALMCPITSQVKQYPFEVAINTKDVRGVALVDQIRSIDWNARRTRRVAKISSAVVREVQAKLAVLLLD